MLAEIKYIYIYIHIGSIVPISFVLRDFVKAILPHSMNSVKAILPVDIAYCYIRVCYPSGLDVILSCLLPGTLRCLVRSLYVGLPLSDSLVLHLHYSVCMWHHVYTHIHI